MVVYYTQFADDIMSFQTGVDTIYNGCKTYGSTPTAKTPSAIVNSIKAIYTNRYNAGVTATKKGNVAPGQVLSGKTFTNSSTVNATGTMPNRGTWTNTPTSSGKVTIPAGYHNGSGYVDTSNLSSGVLNDVAVYSSGAIPAGVKTALALIVVTSNSSTPIVSFSGDIYINNNILINQHTIALTALSSTYIYLVRVLLTGEAGNLGISVSRSNTAGLWAAVWRLIY